jgi:hypothetical protein
MIKFKFKISLSFEFHGSDLFCVGVMYSGEYDVCDVTLSVYPHRASLKNMPGHTLRVTSQTSMGVVAHHLLTTLLLQFPDLRSKCFL